MQKTVIEINSKTQKRLDILRDNSGRLLLTDDQMRAVLEDGHILVSASAGSGKTSTMVKRIILMIAEGASLADMLILVYNNAAADELRERLHQELFRQACSTVGEQREHFRSQIDDIAFCHICTIHAFCQSLIRENFDKLGLSPTFQVLDEKAHNVYMDKAFDDVLSLYAKNGDELFFEIVELFSQSRNDENLKNTIIKLFEVADVQPDGSDLSQCLYDCYDNFENSRFIDILSAYYRRFMSKAKKIFDEIYAVAQGLEHIDKYVERLVNALSVCDEMLNAQSFFDMCQCATRYEKVRFSKSKKATDFENEIASYIKAYFNDFDDVIEEIVELYNKHDQLKQFHSQNAKYVKKIFEIVDSFALTLAKLKKNDNVLSFEDLQHFAYTLLSNQNFELQNEFDAVFVDEYQDVNPMQEAIIQKLVKDKCFIVGDVKQSIYGFRLADPMIFLSRQERYENLKGEGTNIYFNHNFRSAYSILKFVNDVFDTAMTVENADIDYKSDARFELNQIPPVTLEGVSPEGYVQVHLFVKPKAVAQEAKGLYDITTHEEDNDVANATNEGLFIASQIKSLVGRLKGVDENGNGKHLEYGDIAILFRSRSKSADEILKVLTKEGIPVNDGAFIRSASLPEQELVAMLKVLDNPRQDIAMAGYLLSFFGGYDESELAKIASYHGDCLYDKMFDCANNDDALSSKIQNTIDTLDMYRTKASFENFANLMNEIVRDFSFDAYLMRGGEAKVYGLKSFINGVKSQETTLGKFLEEYSEKESSSANSGGGDRVVVSTFHGYKGLENAVVFIADTGRNFNYKAGGGDLIACGKSDQKQLANGKFTGLVGLSAFDFDNKVKYPLTISKLATAKSIRENQIKEEIRLFYVALTRAKQIMYITATVSENKGNDFGTLPRLADAGCDLDFISNAVFEKSTNVPIFKHDAQCLEEERQVEQDEWILPAVDESVMTAIRGAQDYSYPHEQATRLSMKYSVSTLDSIDSDTVRVYQESANVGTIYHKVMQYIDYFAEGLDGVKAEIERMLNQNILTKEECDVVNAQDIRTCLDSQIMQYARECEVMGKTYREKPFMMYKSANELSDAFSTDDKVLVQGVIDLFIDGEKKYIVDFKNSLLRDKEMLERYKKQLYLYKNAVESANSVKIDGVMLYSFKTGKTIVL